MSILLTRFMYTYDLGFSGKIYKIKKYILYLNLHKLVSIQVINLGNKLLRLVVKYELTRDHLPRRSEQNRPRIVHSSYLFVKTRLRINFRWIYITV